LRRRAIHERLTQNAVFSKSCRVHAEADALVWASAAFRKHGVYLSARDLKAA